MTRSRKRNDGGDAPPTADEVRRVAIAAQRRIVFARIARRSNGGYAGMRSRALFDCVASELAGAGFRLRTTEDRRNTYVSWDRPTVDDDRPAECVRCKMPLSVDPRAVDGVMPDFTRGRCSACLESDYM